MLLCVRCRGFAADVGACPSIAASNEYVRSSCFRKCVQRNQGHRDTSSTATTAGRGETPPTAKQQNATVPPHEHECSHTRYGKHRFGHRVDMKHTYTRVHAYTEIPLTSTSPASTSNPLPKPCTNTASAVFAPSAPPPWSFSGGVVKNGTCGSSW